MSRLGPVLPLLAFAIPDLCLACEKPREPATRLGLCALCLRRLIPKRRPACHTCGMPLADAAGAVDHDLQCGACRERPPDFERLLAAFLYRPPGDAVIRGLKFGRLEYLGAELARELAPLVARSLATDPAAAAEFDRVIALPLHWTRRLVRGYNQAERIARPLAAACGLRYDPALRRARWTPPQTSLERSARQHSQRGGFRLAAGADLAGASVLLVDDVMTTGATLRAAAGALRRGGARRVIAVVAARTPGPRERP